MTSRILPAVLAAIALVFLGTAALVTGCAESDIAIGGDTEERTTDRRTSESPDSGVDTGTPTGTRTSNGETPGGTRTPPPPRSSIPEPDELDLLPDDNQLALGDICRRDGQCDSGLCARLEAGVPDGVCTTPCRDDSNCPESWECILIRTSGLDAEFICIDPFFCIDRDGDGYGVGPGCAGPDCDDTDPDRYFGAISRCDNKDNNCNGIVDDFPVVGEYFGEDVEIGAPCSTGDPGICSAGVFVCDNGEVRCQGLNSPRTEVCNGLDDNCNGTVDSGNPGGGLPCGTEFPGICSIGVTECVNGRLDCVPEIGPFSRPEVCNFQDDNCDGTVDTGFRNDQGVYDQIDNCGACGINCNNFWPGGPENFGVRPICAVSGGLATCDFECLPGFVDADGVAENGCELQPDAGAIYVARPINGGADTGSCGTWDAPCATIGHGLTRAADAGAERVRVADGNFRETVTLENGISLLGGHSSVNWSRNPDVFVSVITGQTNTSRPDQWAVRAQGITAPTELSGFTLQAPNGRAAAADSAAGNSIGLFIRNATSELVVENNTINAGDGGAGARGESGGSGQPGVNGLNGALGVNNSSTCPGTVSGGPGGSRTCGGTAVSGGAGANAVCFIINPGNYSASNPTPTNPAPGAGAGPNPGAAGSSGHHRAGVFFEGNVARTVVYAITSPAQGSSGAPGAPGADGSGGAGASNASGGFASNQWRGASGADGGAATLGSGGGGGGSAGSIQICEQRSGSNFNGCILAHYVSPGGGGGGSGGCSGTRGLGGSAGGGSFAIYVRNTGDQVGNLPQIVDNVLSRGAGGSGGPGGNGGAGGEGGDGGSGGIADTSTGAHSFSMLSGADGGTGGRGGHGGGGGGGAGGLSYDILLSGAGGTSPTWESDNTFLIPAGTETAGAGGVGGNSSNTATGLGTAGVAGTSGLLRTLN